MKLESLLLFTLAALPVFGQSAGVVYTTTNAAAENRVIAWDRTADGALRNARFFATGGKGLGTGLGSQGALAMTESGRWLIAVNAGSNDVTVFSASEGELRWRSKTPSGGTQPVSVATRGDHVVVLNAGSAPNISAFLLDEDGKLTPVATRNLNGTAPAEVSFNGDGTLLAVTEKNSNTIDLFQVDGTDISEAQTHASSGATPFGFVFAPRNRLIVTEAMGGPDGTSAISSYAADEDTANLAVITPSLTAKQGAACWAVLTADQRFVFISNTSSDTISSLRFRKDGSLELVKAVAAPVAQGSKPADSALSQWSRFLYVSTPGKETISGFRVLPGGMLAALPPTPGVPKSAAGLVAR